MKRINQAIVGILLAAACIAFLAPQPISAQRDGRGGPGGGGRGGGGGGRGGGRGADTTPIRRMPDGKPDLTGFYQADAGGSNYGLENKPANGLIPGSRGVVIDPPDGRLPYQP